MTNNAIRLRPEVGDARKRRNSLLTSVGCVTCIGIGNSALAAVLPAIARELGISVLASGFIVSASPLVYLFAAPFWGRKADRVGSRVILIIGMIGFSVGALLFALGVAAGLHAWITGYILVSALMAAGIVSSTLGAGTYPAAVALAVSGSAQNERARTIAALSAGYGAGVILGPGIATALVSISLAAPYYFISFLVLLMAGLASRLTVAEQPKQKRIGRRLNMFDRRIVRFLFVSFAIFLVLSTLEVVLGFIVHDKFYHDPSTAAQRTGVLFMIAGLCSLLSQTSLARLKNVPPFIALNIGISSLAGGILLLALGETFQVLAIGAALAGFGIGVSGPMSSAACSVALDEDEQGSGAGFMDSARSAGAIVGPLIGGATYSMGHEVPLFIGIGFLLGAIGLLAVWENRIRRSDINIPRRPG
jgi:DHA1 family multidrug resistance protein-like MFS transporter